MKHRISLDSLSTGIVDALAETASLRERCQAQQLEIKTLNDQKMESEIEIEFLQEIREIYSNKLDEKSEEILQLHELVHTWKENCRVFDDDLVAAKQEIETLRAKQASSQDRMDNLEQETANYRQQMEKMVVVLRNKTRISRVSSIATKAAFKLLPSLEEQTTMRRLYDLSERGITPLRIEREVDAVLREVGVHVSNKGEMQTPEMTPGTDEAQPEKERSLI